MSDEMVTLNADSPAATAGDYGLGNSVVDYVRDAASHDESQNWALNNDGNDYSGEQDFGANNIESEVRQALYDNLINNQPEAVPYERFREVNEQAKMGRDAQTAYDRWADVIRQFESNGYQSAADVQAALQKQQIANQEAEIRNRYNTLTQTEYLDPAIAEAKAEAEINQFRYNQLVEQMSNFMVQQQRDEAFVTYPYARRAENIVDNLVSRGMSPMEAAASVHDQISGLVESLVPQLTDMVASRQSMVTPIDTSYSAQPVVTNQMPERRNALSSISQLLGIGRNPNNL